MKISAIILAAGNSTRFNGRKLLAPFRGKPLIRCTLDMICKAQFHEIILVTQRYMPQQHIQDEKIKVVYNDQAELGISHSIKLGVEAGKACDAYMFFVADQPYLTTELIEVMQAYFKTIPQTILTAGYNGKKGNPTLFSSCYKEELMMLAGDTGGKQIIKRYPEELAIYEVANEQMLQDIDTKEDYIRLQHKKSDHTK